MYIIIQHTSPVKVSFEKILRGHFSTYRYSMILARVSTTFMLLCFITDGESRLKNEGEVSS